MIKKTVSVVIPVYNVERYLRESLLSVMNQDYEELEIVVVNDGSTDSSLEILKDLALKDSRVKVFSKTNGGLASARNYGLQHCSGGFILFFDSDDLLVPNAISTLMKCVIDKSADIVAFGFEKFYENTKIVNTVDKEFKAVPLSTSDYFRLAFDDSFPSKHCNGGYAWARLYKREVIQDFYFDSNRLLYEDEDFTSRLILKLEGNEKLFYIDDVLYLYRQRKSSLVHSRRTKRLFNLYSCRRAILKRCVKDSEQYRIIDRARLITLIKLMQVSLRNNYTGAFSLFKRILLSRRDVSLRLALPYLFGVSIAKRYSQKRIKKAERKNQSLQYWE